MFRTLLTAFNHSSSFCLAVTSFLRLLFALILNDITFPFSCFRLLVCAGGQRRGAALPTPANTTPRRRLIPLVCPSYLLLGRLSKHPHFVFCKLFCNHEHG